MCAIEDTDQPVYFGIIAVCWLHLHLAVTVHFKHGLL